MNCKNRLVFFLLGFISLALQAQDDNTTIGKKAGVRSLIQFTGKMIDRDSLAPVPYGAVLIVGSRRGTVSDYFGYFSIVVRPNDTIEFSAIGYKKMKFIIPDTIVTNRYSHIQVMLSDTIFLKEVTIYPWPNKDEFKDAFLNLDIADDRYEIARKNLELQAIIQQYRNIPNDGGANYTGMVQQQANQNYYAGQYPPNNLLNPIAWAKFIEAWRRGDYKKKKK
jgi:hypothetical protein